MPKFEKGKSGNPSGRPKGQTEIVTLARSKAPDAVKRLAELMDDEDGKVAVAACNSILDRAYGKPVQALASEDGKAAVGVVIMLPAESDG